MEKVFENIVGDSTLTEIFSPPWKVPMPFLYTSFGLSLKESLMSEVFSLLSVTIGNKLKTDSARLSKSNTIVAKRRILVVPCPFIESDFITG
jgi:hypothetical protein